jgi:cytochrome c-type biogenesis protein CcmH
MLLALALSLLVQVPAPATPYDSVALETTVREVSAVLRCPVCQGLSIQDSPAELAVQMKDVVRQQLRAGKTPDEVKAYFVDKYGEWVLLEPKASGVNLLVYGLPLVLLLGGAIVIWFAVRRWSSASAPQTVGETAEDELRV